MYFRFFVCSLPLRKTSLTATVDENGPGRASTPSNTKVRDHVNETDTAIGLIALRRAASPQQGRIPPRRWLCRTKTAQSSLAPIPHCGRAALQAWPRNEAEISSGLIEMIGPARVAK